MADDDCLGWECLPNGFLVGDNLGGSELEGPYFVTVGDEGLKVFGALLRLLRSRSQISPKELAEKVGVHESFVHGIERGAQAPSLETAEKLFSHIPGARYWCRINRDYDMGIKSTDGRKTYAFRFKAEVQGQNRRPNLDLEQAPMSQRSYRKPKLIGHDYYTMTLQELITNPDYSSHAYRVIEAVMTMSSDQLEKLDVSKAKA